MIGLDTNVLARYIVRDDEQQADAATKLIENHCTETSPGFVPQLVLVELFWVLARGYKYDKPVLAKIFNTLLSAAELNVERAEDAWYALRAYQADNADFADYLIGRAAQTAGCETTYTFDRRAARSSLHTWLEDT